jgi:hypothetical protein
LDEDDPSMNTDNVYISLKYLPEVKAIYGLSGTKVKAINRDMELARHWDILINFSDDMAFTWPGFDVRIIEDFKKHFPDGDGFVHYPDGSECGKILATMSIMDRRYYYRTRYIYHPDYTSLWCDNEATEVARKLNRYAYIDFSLFEHRHPAHGKAPADAQYRHTESFFHIDNAVYVRRETINFEIEKNVPVIEEIEKPASLVDGANCSLKRQPLLSILICTLPERLDMYRELWAELDRQIQALPEGTRDLIEIKCDPAPRGMVTTGAKRQSLLQRANGLFIIYHDDDDWPAPNYVVRILCCIICNPTVDCIGIEGFITTDGENKKEWSISRHHGSWFEEGNRYYRTPNHISPVKRSIALQAGFPDKTVGEDVDYSNAIFPHLKSDACIEGWIYHYRFKNRK